MRIFPISLLALLLNSLFLAGESWADRKLLGLNEAQEQWLNDHPIIEIGVDGAWPPIDYFDEQGNHQGIAADYIRYLSEQLGIRFIPRKEARFKDMLERVSNAELSIGSSIAKTPERALRLGFSQPFFTVLKAIVTRRSSPDINAIEDLHNRVVAIEDGFSTMQQLQQQHPDIQLLPVKNTQAALEAVAWGKADAYVGTRAVAQWIIEQQQLTNLHFAGDPGFGPAPQHFAVAQKPALTPLLEMVTLAFDKMPEARKNAIQKRWLGTKSAAKTRPALKLSDQEWAWIQAHPTVRVGGETGWAPFGFLSEHGSWQGITRDYLDLAFKRLGLKAEHQVDPSWKQSLEMLRNGDLDLMGSMVITDERQQYLDFSQSYFLSPYYLVQRRESTFEDNFASMSGQRIAVEKGYFLEGEIRRKLPSAKLILTDNTRSALEAVSSGAADLYLGNRAVSSYLIRTEQFTNLKATTTRLFPPGRLHIGVRKELGPLAGLLSKALADISPSERRQIEQRWLGERKAGDIEMDLQLSPAQSQWLREHPSIRTLLPPDLAPLAGIDGTGTMQGLAIDYLDLFDQSVGHLLQRTTADSWVRAVQSINSAQADLLATTPNTHYWQTRLLLSKPFARFPYVLFTRDSDQAIYALEDLNQKTLLVERFSGPVEKLRNDHPGIQLRLVDSTEEAIKALAAGKADAYLGNLVTARRQLAESGQTQIHIAAPTPYEFGVSWGVRKDWPELVDILNQGLSSLQTQDRLHMQHRWLTIDVDEGFRTAAFNQGLQQTLMYAIPAMLILAIWAMVLHRQRAQIRRSEERYQLATNAVSEGIWEWEPETGSRYFSPGFFHRLGYSDEQIPTEDTAYTALIHPDDRHLRTSKVNGLKDCEDGAFSMEYRLRQADGTYVHVRAEGHCLKDQRKRIGTIRDISELKESERHIRSLTQALEQSPVLVIITNASGHIEYVNSKLQALTGYRESEVLGQLSRMLLSPKVQSRELARLKHTTLTGNEWRGELLHQRKDGSEFWGAVSISPLFDEHGDIMHFISINEDISERRAAEQALRDSEAQLQHVIEMMPLAIIVTDHEGRILFSNPQAAKEIHADHDLVGHYTEEFYAESHTRDEILGLLKQQGRVDALPVRFQTQGEKHIECLLSVIPVHYAQQPALLGVIVNMTERLQIERELASAKHEAEEANRFKSRFLANMSHEIRTPMNAIVGLSHLALQRDPPPHLNDYLHKIQGSAHALLGIINDILDFSRIEAGKLHIESVPFDLDHVLQNLSDLVTLKAEEKGLEILFDVEPGCSNKLIGDPLRLGQVLTNLVGNAIKFTDKGEIKISVKTLDQQAQHVNLRFSVIDTGMGIAQEVLPKLFDSFRQADESTTRRFGGSGLGLAICKELVAAMGGNIQVDSELGSGSRFYFDLTLGYQAADETRTLPLDIRGLRALVVDDNPTARQILHDQLVSFQLQVDEASGAQAGLKLLDQHEYALVLMDWKMPDIDGLQAVEMIRERFGNNTPALIMVTAYGREEIVNSPHRESLDGFLLKPITPSLLFDSIMQALSDNPPTQIHKTKTESLHALRGDLLLVEDNETNRLVAREIIQGFGLNVREAEDGKTAIALLQEHHFDLAVLDIQMPDMDGYQLATHIRQQPQWANLPLLAVTANAMQGDRDRALNAGFDAHIPKPIDPTLLHQELAKHLPQSDAGLLVPDAKEQHSAHLPTSLPDTDMEWGIKRIGGNQKLYARLLKGFHRDFQSFTYQVAHAWQSNNQQQARRLAHTLQGVAANLGAALLSSRAATLEHLIENPDTHDIDDALQEVESMLLPLIQAIKNWDQAQTEELSQQPVAETASTQQIVETLLKHLQEGNPSATQCLAQLHAEFDQHNALDDYTKVQTLLDDYEFDQALESLQSLPFALPGIEDTKGHTS